MAKLKLGVSPITNTIYAGKLNKAGNMWLTKEDVTDQAVSAVAEHLYASKTKLVFEVKGKKFELIVQPFKDK